MSTERRPTRFSRPLYILSVFALAIAPSLSTAQRQLPSDTELRTSYCIPILQAAVTEYQATAEAFPDGIWKDGFAQSAATAADNLKRLQSYIVPKLQHLDTLSLQAALDRGRTDAKASTEAQLSCFKQCESSKPTSGYDDRYGRCLSSCQTAAPVIARTRACQTVNWLPF
jgi:hypothetical protein